MEIVNEAATEVDPKVVMQPSMQDAVLREGGLYDDVPYLECAFFGSMTTVSS